MEKILVTGGAGYIGSHAVYHLCTLGYHVVIIDNLSRGFRECIETLQTTFPNQITFYETDLRDKTNILKVLGKERVSSVMHFAALCSVNESMENPYLYFQNNVYGTANLLEAMKEFEIKNIVFSSTCATYAPTTQSKLDENTDQDAENPYGESKYLAEREIFWYQKLCGINYTILRYFNVCGAQSEGIIGDSKKPSQLLMQNAVRGALGIETFKLTYAETNTPDGSPIRDYINVEDLVEAHVLALKYMQQHDKSSIFNLGTGTGNSVKEIVNKVMEITGKQFEVSKGEPRKGEAKELYADISAISSALGWSPKRSIADSINSLVKWYMKRPNGWEY